MRAKPARLAMLICCVVLVGKSARAQTSLSGSGMAMQSNSSATLSADGYVGTYLVVPAGGATVNFDINATEAIGSVAPHLNLSIADSNLGFTIGSTSASDYQTSNLTLPGGTYLLSVQRDYNGNINSSTPVTVNSLAVNTVTGGAANFSNVNSDTNALAAANTYIANYRQGAATVALTGPSGLKLLPGTPVATTLSRNAFNFGSTVPDTVSNYLTANPAMGSTAYEFQQAFNANFNTMVPENAGKWAENEATQNQPTMSNIDLLLSYAQSHDMTVRMHNLIWGSGSFSGSQQPSWVNNLITSAAFGNATAKANLSSAITNRINYYVGTSGGRGAEYQQIDVLNEPVHNASYLNIYGAGGIANIYNQVASAAAAVGNSSLQLFTNEYNVLQYSSDAYANWYRQYVESIRNAGGNVGGIGFEFYADPSGTGSNAVDSPSRDAAILANLAVDGLPLSLNEFGIKAGTSSTQASAILQDTMTMMFGTPTVENSVLWDFWLGNFGYSAYNGGALYNSNWTLTAVGQAYQSLMSQWTTNLTGGNAPTVDANGSISFNGFYGDYNIGGSAMTLAKGTANYNLSLAAPPDWSIWKTGTSGNWSTSGNWTTGGIANLAGQTAYFGNAATPTTVTVTSPQTIGMLAFDSGSSYTVEGNSPITLQGFDVSNGHVAEIYVVSGNHFVTAPLKMQDDTTITVASADSALTISNLQSSTANITKSGPGTLMINAIAANGLSVDAGTVRILGDSGMSEVNNLNVGASAILDLTDNSLAVDYVGNSPFQTLDQDVANGYDGGKWDLSGIVSSTAAGNFPYSVGIRDTGQQVLIRYTLIGDANLDGWVNEADWAMIESDGNVWSEGDFNYDGKVNADDMGLFLLGLAESKALGHSVPEPNELAIMLIAIGCLPVRISRRNKSAARHYRRYPSHRIRT